MLKRPALERSQLRIFRKLAAHAARHSPYYADLVQARDIDMETCVPADFPILCKSDFIANFDRIVTDRSLTRERIDAFLSRSNRPDELLDGRYLVVHTSGTSGTVAYYVHNTAEWERGHAHIGKPAVFGRAFLPGLSTRKIAHIAAMSGHFHGATMAYRARGHANRRLFDIRPFDVNLPRAELIERLNDFQPDVISGYGGAVRILAQHQESGDLSIRPRWLFYGGEPMSQGDRDHAESVFGAPVKSVYATSEHLMMGASEASGRLRLFEENMIFEFAPDHTVITNLFNYTMPLIRYRMDDVLEPLGPISRSHSFMLTRDVVGRSEALLEFETDDGGKDFIHPIVVAEFFHKDVLAFQVVQFSARTFDFAVVINPRIDSAARDRTVREVRDRLAGLLAQKRMSRVEFAVKPVDALDADPRTGKFRLIVRRDLSPAGAD